jgi:hypothetical protein
MAAGRVSGWSCEHATITVSTTYPPPAAVTMAWCGCPMEPVYAADLRVSRGVTIRYPGAA